ncbi:MAG: aminotransferase class V-fold PLP-dependent enzyme [Bacteroidetes bacterium]|nr:aminotransferase class V-fold PLP-dependent enzyme [Bacteroidota bacterium]
MHYSTFHSYWHLDAETVFLNHGSFGACPKPVLEKQQELRLQLETQPLRFFMRGFEKQYFEAKEEVARFVHAANEDVVFVPNVTHGINTILRSLRFKPGDEILTTNQEYPANRHALNFLAGQTGVRIVIADLDFPVEGPERIIQAIMAKVSSRTRLALIDHITSPTGIILPVEEIINQLEKQGIDTLIDGAHALGMIPLDLQALGATYYTANGHKWLCSPKGSAFLYVRKDRQHLIHPLVISHAPASDPHNPQSDFQLSFFWTGTNDPTPFLCMPEAIRFMGSLLPGGWDELMKTNRELTLQARREMCRILGIHLPCPDEMIGTLCALPIPDGHDARKPPYPHNYIEPLQEKLYRDYHIEVPVIYWPEYPRRVIRTATQIYNTIDQFIYLAESLKKIFS